MAAVFGYLNRSFGLFLSTVLAVQPAFMEAASAQQVIIDPNGNVGARLQAGKPAPVVDIARPNTGGVSHNRYKRLNTPADGGVVLNNSAKGSKTAVAGQIAGNSNLTGGSATTIVNEVTSTEGSALNGRIEVAGDQADVIVANPNGINCDGCSFLNTKNATLTTGVPVINGGNVQLDVTKGTITIGRKGLAGAATGVGSVNLIGRTVVIDGKVTAVDGINVQGGAQRYDLTAGKRAADAKPSGAAGRDYAIDGTAFGAMEAGRIQIVGNEQGLGVRLRGAVQATGSDATVSNPGKVEVSSASAQRNVAVSSAASSVAVDRDLSAVTGQVTVNAGTMLTLGERSGIYSKTGINLRTSSGELAALGDLQSGAGIGITGPRLRFSAYASAAQTVRFVINDEATVTGATIVAQQIDGSSFGKSLGVENSAFFSSRDVQLASGSLTFGRDVVSNGLKDSDKVKLIAKVSGDFRNRADLRNFSAMQITWGGDLYNEAGGVLADKALVLDRSKAIHNSGVIYGDDSLKINAAGFFNNATGSVLSKSVQITSTGALTNLGSIISEGDLRMSAASALANDGFVQAAKAWLNGQTIENRGKGDFRIASTLSMTAKGDLINRGSLNALGSATLQAGQLVNNGMVLAEGGITATAKELSNAGSLTSKVLVRLRGDTIANTGVIASYDRVDLVAGKTASNSGSLIADKILSISGPVFANTGDKALVRTKTGQISSATITNAGKIFLVDDFTRKGDLDLFRNDGTFASAGGVSLTGRDAKSQILLGLGSALVAGLRPDDKTQTLIAGKSVSINAATISLSGQKTGKTFNRAQIRASADIGLTTPGILNVGGSIQTQDGNISLSGKDIVLSQAGAVYAGGTGTLTSAGGLSNAGSLVVKGALGLSAGFGRLSNSGVIEVGQSARLTLAGAFANTGYMGSEGALALTATSFANDGHLQSSSWMDLTSAGDMRLKGATVAGGNMSLTAGNLVLDKGGMTLNAATGKLAPNIGFISAGYLQVKAASFTSRGSINLTGVGDNTWTVAGNFRQEGQTHSEGHLTVTAGGIASVAGSQLGSSGNLLLQGAGGKAAKDILLSGSATGQHVTIRSAAAISMRAPSVLSASGNITLDAQEGVRLAGQVSAKNYLNIKSKGLNISGTNYAGNILANAAWIDHSGKSDAKQALRLTATGSLVNSGKISSADKMVLTGGKLLRNADGGNIGATDLSLRVTSKDPVAAFENEGKLLGAKKLSISTVNLRNTAGALIRAGTANLTASGDVRNFGTIHGFGVFAKIGGGLTNAKLIRGDEIIAIVTQKGAISNTGDGRVFAKIIGLSSGAGLINNGHIGAAGSTMPNATSTQLKAVGGIVNNGAVRGNDIKLVGGSVINSNNSAAIASKVLRIETEKYDLLNHGVLQGNEATVITQGNVENHGRLTGNAKLGVVAKVGRIYNNGTVQGKKISLLAVKGALLSENAISAEDELLSKAVSAEFKSWISAGNNLSVETSGGHLTLASTAAAKKISLKSAAILKARGGAVRGADTTQIVAGDIQRTDTTATNRKLGVVPASVGSLYVELKSGSFGSATTNLLKDGLNIGITQYEQASLSATGPVEIVASRNLFLTGMVKSQKSITLQGKASLALRNVGLTSGSKIYAEGKQYLRNYGNVALTANTVALNQNWGWFYTSDWLPEKVNYNLIVGAKSIVVNSDHRFIGKTVTLRAADDIQQMDSVISARGIEYVAGKNINVEFDPFDWRSQKFTGFVSSYGINPTSELYIALMKQTGNPVDNPSLGWKGANDANKSAIGKANTSEWWDTVSGGLRGHALIAQGGGVKLTAKQDITLRSGKLHSEAAIEITAGGRFLSEPIYIENNQDERPVGVGWAFDNRYSDVTAGHDRSRVQMNELRAYENQISAKGNISISAVKNLDLIGTRVASSTGNISLKSALGSINMLAAPGYWTYDYEKKSKAGNIVLRKTKYIAVSRYFDIYKKTALSAARGNIEIISIGQLIRDKKTTVAGADPKNAIVSAGTELSAKNVTVKTRHSSQSILLGTYTEESVDETKKWTKRKLISVIPFGKSDSTRTRRVTMQIGNDFLADEILDLKSAANLTIVGGSLKGRTVKVAAAGNLNIQAAINSVYESNSSRTDNMVTITTINSGKIVETASLPKISSVQPASFEVGGKVTISGYNGPALNTLVLNTISSRKFDDRILQLYTPKDTKAADIQGKAVSGTYSYTLPKGGDYAYLQTLLKDKKATYETITLRDQKWYDKQVQMNPAFQALLTVAISAATGGIGGLSVWQKAVLDSALNSAASGSITGNFDAKKALREALTAGASAYVSGSLSAAFGLTPPKSGEIAVRGVRNNFTPKLIRDRLGSQLISHGVGNVAVGKSPLEGLDKLGRSFLVTESMGIVQNGIGDLGIGKGGKWEGSLGHMLLHGGVGCVAMTAMNGTCAAGFFAGASQSVLTKATMSDAEKANLAPLIGSMAGFLFSEGKAIGVSFAGTIAQSGIINNACSHDLKCWTTEDEKKALDSGDYALYYSMACLNGDQYTCLALGVATGSTLSGKITNANFYATGLISGVSIGEAELEDIRIKLARRYAASIGTSPESAVTPSRSKITQIHWDVFGPYGIPRTAFGGSSLFILGSSPDSVIFPEWPFDWCKNCGD